MRTGWRATPVALALLAGLISGCNESRPGDQTASKVAGERASAPVTLPAGTIVTGTLQNTVASDRSHVGEPVTVTTTAPVSVNGRVVLPAGTSVRGAVTHVRSAGRFKGAAELTVRFDEVVLPGGGRRAATFEPVRRVVKGDGKETAAEIGGGAAAGGIVGGVLGGGDGALKGGAIGGALGTGIAAATPGQQIVLRAGDAMTLRLTAPISMELADRR